MKHIILLLATSFLFRFLYLGIIPVSLSHDETDMIIQAHSIIHTGRDIAGDWKPTDFLPNSGVMAELSPVINLPALSMLPNNLFTAHLTTALLSGLFPLLVFYWLKLLGVETAIGMVSAWLLALSPWHILFSRTTLEQPTSLFFYFVSWIYLAKIILRNRVKYSPLINSALFTLTYSLGFFMYHGYKFSMPILTAMFIGWLWFIQSNKSVKKYLILPSVIVILLIVRTVLNADSYLSRSSELIFFNNPKLEQKIDTARRLSLAPDTLKRIYSNKPLNIMQQLKDKYVNVLDPDLLFLHGEANGVFSIWQYGYLYLATLPFLIIGFGYMLLNYKREHILILGLLVLSPIASVIHVQDTLAFKSAIYFVLLNIVASYGIIQAYKKIQTIKSPVRFSLIAIFVLSFVYSVSYFSYIYFFVSPVTNANSYFFSDRVVANYVRLTTDQNTMILTKQPRYMYSAIVLANKTITSELIRSFDNKYSPSEEDDYQAGNITITRDCITYDQSQFDTLIVHKDLQDNLKNCPALRNAFISNEHASHVSVVSPRDSGEEYQIYGDKICEKIDIRTYVHPTNLGDFKLETMTRDTFCQKWIVRQN